MKRLLRCVLVMSVALLLGAATAAKLPSQAKSAGGPTKHPTTQSLLESQTQRMLKGGGKARFQYRFQLSGSDVVNGLRVSNLSNITGVVRVIADGPEGSAPAKMFRKIAAGDSVDFAPEELGWLSGDQVVVKMSPGLTASLTSASHSMQLPRVKGISVYDVFSSDRRAEIEASSGNTTVVPLTASAFATAKDLSGHSTNAGSGSIWVAYGKAPSKKGITQ